MPDNNGDQPTPINAGTIVTGNIDTGQIKSNSQTVDSMTVTRLDVQTGDSKDAQSDSVNQLTKTIDINQRQNADTIKNMMELLHKNAKDTDKNYSDTLKGLESIARVLYDGTTGITKSVTNSSDASISKIETAIETLTRNLSQTLGTADAERNMAFSQTIGDVAASVHMVTSASEYVSKMFDSIAGAKYSPVAMGGNGPVSQTAYENRIRELVFQWSDRMNKASADQENAIARQINAEISAISQTTRQYSLMHRALGSFNSQLATIVGNGVISKFQGNLLSTIHTVQNWASNLVDISKVSRGGAEHLTKSLDIAATGVSGIYSPLFEVIPAFTQGADSMASTFSMLQFTLSNDLINPIGIMGSDLREVSQNMRAARMGLYNSGNAAVARLSSSASNEAIMSLFDLQRRVNINSQITDSKTLSALGSQLTTMQLIASNTGTTVDAIVKMNKSISTTLYNSASAGILSGKQAEVYLASQTMLMNKNMNGIAELVAGLAQNGGNAQLYLANNPEMAKSLAASGTMGTLFRLENLMNTTQQTDKAYFQQMMNIVRGFKSQTNLGAVGSQILSTQFQQISGEAGKAGQVSQTPEISWIQNLMFRVKDIFTNYIGTTGGLVISLGANTAALIANTAALYGGFGKALGKLTGLIFALPKMLFRGISGSIGLGATAVRAGASAVMGTGRAVASGVSMGGSMMASGVGAARSLLPEAGAIAGAARGLGTMVARSMPLIGTIMGLYDAVNRVASGDYMGALWSAGAGVMATVNPLASMGMYAGLVGRDAYNAYNAPSTTAAPMSGYMGMDQSLASPSGLGGQYTSDATINQGLRNDTQQLIWSTNQALYDLISIAQSELSVLKVIANNTSTGQTEVPVGFFDWLTGAAKTEREKASAKNAATYSPPRETPKK